MKSKNTSLSDRRQLFICRHAKSSWSDASLRDFDRPLNRRGEKDAPEMGRRLARRGVHPDLIMTSPAFRALQTASHYADQLAYPRDRLLTNPLQYAATARQLLALLQQTAPEVRTLLLVGHNPESTELANMLGGLNIDNIPTSGIVALSFVLLSWRELAPDTGQLLFFDYPKKSVAPS